MKTAQQLQRSIMRRIYYAYALMLTLHPVAIRFYLLAIAALVLAKLVHVAAVWNSFSSVTIGELGTYLAATLSHADWATLGVSFFALMIMLSFRMPTFTFGRRLAM